jgi:hypothetical protein
MRFVTKKVVIEAVQWTGDNKDEIIVFTGGKAVFETHIGGDLVEGHAKVYNKLVIPTLEGNHYAIVGDFIIKGLINEFYPCKSEVFWKKYEKISDKKIWKKEFVLKYSKFGNFFSRIFGGYELLSETNDLNLSISSKSIDIKDSDKFKLTIEKLED